MRSYESPKRSEIDKLEVYISAEGSVWLSCCAGRMHTNLSFKVAGLSLKLRNTQSPAARCYISASTSADLIVVAKPLREKVRRTLLYM